MNMNILLRMDMVILSIAIMQKKMDTMMAILMRAFNVILVCIVIFVIMFPAKVVDGHDLLVTEAIRRRTSPYLYLLLRTKPIHPG